MELSTAQYLTSPHSEPALHLAAELVDENAAPHTALARLQKLASPEEARSAWDLACLRRRAQAKFGPDARLLFFDREALEMASPAPIADYHAARFQCAGVRHILDLGGGIGADSFAFARAGLIVTLYERDPARALMAQANARALGLSERIGVVCADVSKENLPAADAAFLDPARRSTNRRWNGSVDELEPPLSFLRELRSKVSAIGVKLSPAIPHEIAEEYDAEIEFLSHAGECKEAFLVLGNLKRNDAFSAVVLYQRNDRFVEERLSGDPASRCLIEQPDGRYLYEPDPAVIRAHLVAPLAARLSAWQFDPQIAYLIGNELIETPFAHAYEIRESLPYNRKSVQETLRRLGIGRVVIKKRGFPEEPESVRKQFRLEGDREAVLFLTRCGKRHWAFIAHRVDRAG